MCLLLSDECSTGNSCRTPNEMHTFGGKGCGTCKGQGWLFLDIAEPQSSFSNEKHDVENSNDLQCDVGHPQKFMFLWAHMRNEYRFRFSGELVSGYIRY